MKRGDIVLVADPNADDVAGEARPALVVQTDPFLTEHASVTVCLITSQRTGLSLFRVPIQASEQTGLRIDGEISIDKLQTVWRHRIGGAIGAATTDTMVLVDDALRRWLAL